jgi:hypothetical protein
MWHKIKKAPPLVFFFSQGNFVIFPSTNSKKILNFQHHKIEKKKKKRKLT